MESTSAPIEFVRAEPQVFVRDIASALLFYRETLGFDVRVSYGQPPFYAQVCRGEAFLNLRLVSEPVVDRDLVRTEEYLTATICVTSIRSLFEEFCGRGAVVFQGLRAEPWGAHTFIVEDPDGNLILFAE